MAFVFRVIGSHGVAQIDADYCNLHYKASGTISFSNVVGTYVEVTVTAKTPFMVLKAQAGLVTTYSVRQNGDSYTYRFMGDAWGTVTWVLFDKAEPVPGAEYVFRIRTSDNQLAFDSGSKPLIIAGLIKNIAVGPADLSGGNNNGKFADIPDGNYGFAVTNTRAFYVGTPGGQGSLQMESVRVSRTAVYVWRHGTPSSSERLYDPGVADVILINLDGIA